MTPAAIPAAEPPPPEVWAALAQVCGFHDGDPCAHCAETIEGRRLRGWSWDALLADIDLYRTDRRAWEHAARVRHGQVPA